MNTRKAFARVKTTSGDGSGSFEAILSTSNLDRDGEVIKTRAFDPLPDSIPIDADHGMSVATTVGSAKPWYDDDGNLRVTGTFAGTTLGQEVRQLVTEGHISTLSVAFMDPVYGEKDNKNVITAAELLNGAFVAIPSNRESVVLSAKAGARNSRTDQEIIQQIYDLAMLLGASIPEPVPEEAGYNQAAAEKAFSKAVAARDVKQVAGSYEYLRGLLCDALRALYPSDGDGWPYVWLYATFADRVVYTVSQADSDQEYEASYSLDADGVVTFGDPAPVDIVETVQPDTTETPPGVGQAPAVRSAPADMAVAEQEQAAAKARAVLARFQQRRKAAART